jgi:hypothetical protein
MRTYKPSILIEASDEKLIAAVEAHSRQNMSEDLATEIRSAMSEYGYSAHIPYIIVLSQDRGFLWKNDPSLNGERPPDYEFSMDSVIARFSKSEPGKRLIKWGLEDLVLHWLTNLSFKPEEMGKGEPEDTLARAGFTDAIHDAMVVMRDTL